MVSLPLTPRCCGARRGLQLLRALLPTSFSWANAITATSAKAKSVPSSNALTCWLV